MRSFLVLSFLLFALAAKQLPRAAANDDDDRDAVLDTDGKKLRTGTKYYILPANNGKGGGLTLYDNDSDRCSSNVAQEKSDGSNGLPVSLKPAKDKKGVIYLDTDLNIKFTDSSSRSCGKSNVWKVDNYDDSNKRRYIKADGVEGNHGKNTESNWFKIEKDGDYYKLRSCPDCDGCSRKCKDLGVYDKGSSKRLLATSDDALKVKFKKA